MTCTEDQFRAILREEAADIAPDSVPAFVLPDGEANGLTRSRARVGFASRGWRRWLVPLGAAAAVTAIAVAATVIGGSTAPEPRSAATGLWHGVPRYYFLVAWPKGLKSPEVEVRDIHSGATLATARSPLGCQFFLVSAAADDRTFAIACNALAKASDLTMRLFLARFDPVNGRLSVTAMHLPEIHPFQGMALSLDGPRIAVVSHTGSGRKARSALRVYSVATGVVRTWGNAPGGIVLAPWGSVLSWGPGPVLAFDYDTSNFLWDGDIRLLNTDAPPGSLLGVSRLALPSDLPGGYHPLGVPAISGNGATFATVLIRVHDGHTYQFAEFSTATGRMLQRWAPTGITPQGILWSDSTGNTLVAIALTRRDPSGVIGILTGGQFTPLPQVPTSFLSIAF